jgi:hypothetical protein
MKKASKLIAAALTAMALFITINVEAQTTPANKFDLSLGIESGLPTGNAANYSTFILGGNIRLQYGISDSFAVTFSTGGYHFFSQKIPGTDVRYSSYGVGPIKAGFKEFFVPDFYVAGEAGIGREVSQKGFAGGQTKLLLAPGIGYANKKWDLGIVYESLTGDQNDYGFVGLRIGYGFSL